jgi:hypothetical protein
VNELKRLLSEGATDFERCLLGAVVNERPSVRLRSRMMRGLGVSSVITLWAVTAQAMVTSAAGKFVIGLAAASVVVGGALSVGGQREAREAKEAEAVLTAPHEPSAAPGVARRASDPEPSVAAFAPLPADLPNALRAQIELLDAAKRAVNRGDAVEAAALLDRFDERFPDGVLRSEARTLRRAARTIARR